MVLESYGMGSWNWGMRLGSREMGSWNCVVGLKSYWMRLRICRMVLGNCSRAEARDWDRTLKLWGRDLESYRVGLGRCTQCRMVLWDVAGER